MLQLVKFGDVIESITIRVDDPQTAGVDRYVGLEHLDSETVTVGRWGSPSDVEATKLRFFIGDVIYGRRRAYQRKLGRANFEGICSAHALVLRGKAKKCLSEFLPYFLQSERFHKRAMEISVGSLSPTINWSTLKVQEFAFPGLDEQARIVELMTAVDEHLDALRSQLEVAKGSRAAVLHHLLSAGSDDWVNTTLGELVSLRTGKLDVNAGVEDGEYPFFTCSRDTYKIDIAAYSGKSVIVAGNGDLNVKYYEGEFNAYQRTYILQVTAESVLNPLFLFHFMDKYVETLRSETQGTTIQYLKKAQFTEAPISLPPIVEQKRIVEIVSSMDDVIQATEQAIAEAKVLRTTLLNQEIS
jgi:type I restriction enzyme S subunit